MHLLVQLPNYMTISSLIHVFMIISHSSDTYISFSPYDWYPIYTISLQVISKIYTIFAGDWWNRQFWRGLIKSKHDILFWNWVNFCDRSCKNTIILQWISKIHKIFLKILFCSWLDKFNRTQQSSHLFCGWLLVKCWFFFKCILGVNM